MDVLVTGAGGFSGSHVVPALLARGHRVTAIVGRTRGRLDPSLDGSALTVISGDLAERLPLPPRMDAVVHTAARSPAPDVTSADMVRDNVIATQRLIDYAVAAGAGTFIYFSSLSIYGPIRQPVVDEAASIAAAEPYGLTKYLGEMALRETALRTLSIRLPGVIGRNSVRNWLSGVLAAAKAACDITLYNPQNPFNNAAHIKDLSRFIADLLESAWTGHDAVTVGAAGLTTVRGAVELICDTLYSRSRLVEMPPREAGFQVSSTRAIDRYGYRPMEIGAMLRAFAGENRD